MKFAIPIAKGKLAAHFGRCEEFALIEVEEDKIKSKEVHIPPPHEPGVLPKWLHDLGTNVIIASGIGSRAIDYFVQKGLQVHTGAQPLTSEELVENYLDQSLITNENLWTH